MRSSRFAKQVDRRRAEERQAVCVDHRHQRRIGPREQHHDFDLGRLSPPAARARPPSSKNSNRCGRHADLLQQPVARESPQRFGQQRLVGLEAQRARLQLGAQRSGRASWRWRRQRRRARRSRAEHQFVQPKRHVVGRADVEGQVVDAQLREARGRRRRAGACASRPWRYLRRRPRASGRSAACVKYCTPASSSGHSVHRVRGAELAVRVLPSRQLSTARRCRAARGWPPASFGSLGSGQARDHHRRHRRQEVRVERLEQVRDESRELGVELELHARRQEGETLEQALDVRVGDLEPLHAQARRDLRELLRELGAHLAQVTQFLVVRRSSRGSIDASQRRRYRRRVADLDPARLEVASACAAGSPAAPAAPTAGRGSRTRSGCGVEHAAGLERTHAQASRAGCAARSRRMACRIARSSTADVELRRPAGPTAAAARS